MRNQAKKKMQQTTNNNVNTETNEPKFLSAAKRKRKHSTEMNSYSEMEKTDLIGEIDRLNKHVNQLKILLEKANSKNSLKSTTTEQTTRRGFDFSKYHKRHILLKFAYIGWNYQVSNLSFQLIHIEIIFKSNIHII